jgi:hypothetical protein
VTEREESRGAFFLWKVLLRYPSRTYDVDVVMKRLRLVHLLIDWRMKAPIERLTNIDLSELQQLFSINLDCCKG